ncbi:MAG: class IV adenylate cyclase [Desulfobacterales bacterium]|nr:class IV adenylate cyclase [Desulfobacterales bacterium]
MKKITDNTEYLETEVKFLITDAGGLREKLISLGAVSGGNFFETNIRFDNKNKSLFKNKSLLRLRKDAKTTLTFKSRPPVKDNRFKIMRELEVEVGDFSIAGHILESLGFIKEQIYEKWRETFITGDTVFCIDKMPYGDFLEIEGQKEEIIKCSSLLGLDWEKRILLNYLELFDILKTSLGLPFSDVTFENFKNIRIDFSRYLNKVKAGRM